MELAFQSRALLKMATSRAIAEKKLGPAAGSGFVRLLADLKAANSITDLPYKTEVLGVEAGSPQMLWTVEDECAVVAVPNHWRYEAPNAAGIDWSSIYRIKIVSVARGEETFK